MAEEDVWGREKIQQKVGEFIKKHSEFMKYSFEETFLGGGSFTGKEDLEIQDNIRKNIELLENSDYEYVAEEINKKFDGMYTLTNVSLTKALLTKNVGEKKENFGSKVEKHMHELFSKMSKKMDVVKEKAKKITSVKITDKQKKNARMAVQTAFYSYMFFGVQSVLIPDFMGDFGVQLPYVPDVIIGTVPFYSVQRLERGMSDRILKYRAVGDVFLAHQRGSTDTLRLDMKLFGPYKGWYLLYLLSLQQAGQSRLKELPINEIGLPSAGEQITIPKEGKIQYESHVTFPVITQNAIMLDMFLQTIEWHHNVDQGGHQIIHVHLLFRKHINPLSVNVVNKDSKKGHLNYGDTLAERRRKELFLDTAWKAKEIGREVMSQGLFDGTNVDVLNREAITSDPYITDIFKLLGGYSYDINDMASIWVGLG